MVSLQEVEVSTETGLEGDYRGHIEGRQVTVISQEAWQTAVQDLDPGLPWATRRANLLVEGVELADTIGSTLRIGPVLLRVAGETTPCPRMDEARLGLRDALTPNWGGGACCGVLVGGQIQCGDSVTLEVPDRQPAG
jgi:MOSC domain-containing protein YiiM